jgi:hypothetical protein
MSLFSHRLGPGAFATVAFVATGALTVVFGDSQGCWA